MLLFPPLHVDILSDFKAERNGRAVEDAAGMGLGTQKDIAEGRCRRTESQKNGKKVRMS